MSDEKSKENLERTLQRLKRFVQTEPVTFVDEKGNEIKKVKENTEQKKNNNKQEQ